MRFYSSVFIGILAVVITIVYSAAKDISKISEFEKEWEDIKDNE